jgi:hypothetical protein
MQCLDDREFLIRTAGVTENHDHLEVPCELGRASSPVIFHVDSKPRALHHRLILTPILGGNLRIASVSKWNYASLIFLHRIRVFAKLTFENRCLGGPGLIMFARIPLPANSAVQVRTNDRHESQEEFTFRAIC